MHGIDFYLVRVFHETNKIMSHFFVLLIQIPYVILSLICGVSVIISNWNEYVVNRKQTKAVYMLLESTEVETEPEMDFAQMAA